MKIIIILAMTVMTTLYSAHAQSPKTSLEQVIYQFVNAFTVRDVHGMHYLLHEKFQSVETFGILSKTEYMKLLGDGKLGGTRAEPQIVSVDLGETSASMKVRISNNSECAELLVHLYKNRLGSWQILHVLPYIHQKV